MLYEIGAVRTVHTVGLVQTMCPVIADDIVNTIQSEESQGAGMKFPWSRSNRFDILNLVVTSIDADRIGSITIINIVTITTLGPWVRSH